MTHFDGSRANSVEMKGIMTNREIQDLLRRAQDGDQGAFEVLVNESRDEIARYVRLRVGAHLRERVDVEDVLQDTQLRALESIGRFVWRGEDSFFRWLCVIAQHLIWNASKKRSRRETRLVVEPPGPGMPPSTDMRRKERLDRLEQSLRNLRPDEREAVHLSRIEGLRIREVAERMNRPESTVQSIIARALKKLRDSFGDTESLHLPDRHSGAKEDGP